MTNSVRAMALNKYQKIFGVGPLGAFISFLSFGLAWLVDRGLGHPQILSDPSLLRWVALVLFALGLFLHFWTLVTLKNWWKKDRLCTKGPFKYLRHPMYAVWVSFIAFGLALFFNSRVILA